MLHDVHRIVKLAEIASTFHRLALLEPEKSVRKSMVTHVLDLSLDFANSAAPV